MRIPSLHSAWNTTGGQLIRLARRVPRPGRRAALALLVLAAAGAFILPRLPQVMPARRASPYAGGGAAPQPATGPALEGQDEAAYRLAKDGGVSPGGDNVVQHIAGRAGAPSEPSSIPWGRRIIRRANLQVELSDVDRGIARLAETVEAAGGYVADTQAETDAKGTWRATVIAYVPPDRFGRALAALEGLGRVTSRRIGGQDVSEEFVDLEARARNLERHEAQLLAFMGKAQKVADLLSLENELARVRGEIERLAGRIRFLKARTEMATIQIGLVRTPLATPPDDTFARLVEQVQIAFREGWYAAFHVAAGLLVLAAQWSPLAVASLAGWVFYRRWARRRPATPAPAAPEAG